MGIGVSTISVDVGGGVGVAAISVCVEGGVRVGDAIGVDVFCGAGVEVSVGVAVGSTSGTRVTSTREEESAVVPLPSCPEELLPTHLTFPSRLRQR